MSDDLHTLADGAQRTSVARTVGLKSRTNVARGRKRADPRALGVDLVRMAASDIIVAPAPWMPALEGIVDLLHGDHALLVTRATDQADRIYATGARMDDRALERFLAPEAVRALEPFRRALPRGEPVKWSQLVPDRDFEMTGFYNDVVRPANGFYAVVARQELSSLSCFLAICRPRRAGDYTAADVTMLRAILPYLTTALELHRRLQVAEVERWQLACILDRLQDGVLLVDGTARILFANRAAERLFDRDGLRLDAGRLRAADSRATRALRRAIAATATDLVQGAAPGGWIEVPRDEMRAPLNVLVAPFRPEAFQADVDWQALGWPAAILVVSDPEQDARPDRHRSLRELFGLTAAEADLAAALLAGESLNAYADRRGRTLNTVKTHLKAVFAKTGTSRQAELVRRLASVPLLTH